MSIRHKGMTLVEILVTVGLVLVLMVACLWLFLPILNALGRGTARSEVQEQAVLSLYRIEEELRRSAPEGIQVFSQADLSPTQCPGLIVSALKDVDADGRRVWAPQLQAIWWDRAGQRLCRKDWPPKTPAGFGVPPTTLHPACLNAAEYISLVETTSNGSERPMAKGVTQFDAVDAGVAECLFQPLTLSITLERREGHQSETFQARQTITLRSQ